MTRRRASCSEKAAELLANRPHFRGQLGAKLRTRGYSDDEIEQSLERMEGHGYLDDRQTAIDFVERRLARGPVGRRRLAAELTRRLASSDAVSAALAQLPDDDRPAARAAADRWLARRTPRGDARAALARYLDRQGFSPGAVREVVETAGF